MNTVSRQEWDVFLRNYPNAHILQTSAWGEFKARFGWQPLRVIAGQDGAQILLRRLPLGLSIAYIPKGPLGVFSDELSVKVEAACKAGNAMVLHIEPDAWESAFDARGLVSRGFVKSQMAIQPQRTITVSLDESEEKWLERMKQKTRYNIRLAQKKEVEVRISSDVGLFNRLMKVTGERNVFGIHHDSYYQAVYDEFFPSGACQLLVAYTRQTPLAALMLFTRGERAWYFYGASSDVERNRMPTYLLQFEAMKMAKQKGCRVYDLWGIPDFEEQELEDKFLSRSDGLWSVYRFKRGFGGEVRKSAACYEKVFRTIPHTLVQAIYRLRKRDWA